MVTARPAPARTLLLALACLAGCAHAGGRPAMPSPDPAPATAVESRPSPAAPSRAAPGPARGAPDPSEEITAEELASIPDPVPPEAGSRALGGREGSEPPSPSPSPSQGLLEAPGGDPEGDPGIPGWVWRVQIFASADLFLADREGKKARALLGAPAHIEFGGGLYRVRLGDFPTEGGAQALRERAIREGYPGAFRVRSRLEPTSSKD